MSDAITPLANWCVTLLEAIGIGIITLGAISSLFRAGIRWLKRDAQTPILQKLRLDLGQGILLGLEFLIAADIIQTVAVDLSFESVGVLAAIVLIRTFLSFTLEVELTGRWPWQDKQQ